MNNKCNCVAGEEWDPMTKACEPMSTDKGDTPYCGVDGEWNFILNQCDCGAGEEWNSMTKTCEPMSTDKVDTPYCGVDGEWDSVNNKCNCVAGEKWNPKTKACERIVPRKTGLKKVNDTGKQAIKNVAKKVTGSTKSDKSKK